jgi:hypothetical protein
MATVVDLHGIITAIKTLLDNCNAQASSPVDLSNGMTQRVKKVMTINPDYIIPQATNFPFVTSFVTAKSKNREDIAKDQLNAKRDTTITIEVVGAVFNSNIVENTEDPALKDIYLLMENVELILRSDYRLGGTVSWQSMSDVKYFAYPLDTRNHIRTGVLTLNARILY